MVSNLGLTIANIRNKIKLGRCIKRLPRSIQITWASKTGSGMEKYQHEQNILRLKTRS